METTVKDLTMDIETQGSTISTLTKSVEDTAAETATKMNLYFCDIQEKDSTIEALTTENKLQASTMESLKKTKLEIEGTITEMETESQGLKTVIVEMEQQQQEAKEAIAELVEREVKVTNQFELLQNELVKETNKFEVATKLSQEEITALRSELQDTKQQLTVFLEEQTALQLQKDTEVRNRQRRMELQQRNLLQDRLQRDYRLWNKTKLENEMQQLIQESRQQPKSLDLEQELSTRYSSITDVSLRAHKILLDLKMV